MVFVPKQHMSLLHGHRPRDPSESGIIPGVMSSGTGLAVLKDGDIPDLSDMGAYISAGVVVGIDSGHHYLLIC